jgi:hypothetical protein
MHSVNSHSHLAVVDDVAQTGALMSRAIRVSTFNMIRSAPALKAVARTATAAAATTPSAQSTNCKEVMTRKRVSASLAIAAAVVGVAGTVALPVASADTLSNGLDIICNPAGGGVTCVIGGCPRVNGDHVVDAVHVRDSSGRQDELDFKCINGALASKHFDFNSEFTIGVQACRKNTTSSDDCTPFSSYTYNPPAPPPAPPPKVDIGPPVLADDSTPAPAPAPAPAPPPAQAPPATKKATVSADVDLYDVPGGNGNVVGTLRQGQQVQLLERRADNWCHVSGTTVAGHDTGWAWGDYISG